MSPSKQVERPDGPEEDVRARAVQHLREKMTAGELARNLADRLSGEQLAHVASGDLSFLNRDPNASAPDVQPDRLAVPAETVDHVSRGPGKGT